MLHDDENHNIAIMHLFKDHDVEIIILAGVLVLLCLIVCVYQLCWKNKEETHIEQHAIKNVQDITLEINDDDPEIEVDAK